MSEQAVARRDAEPMAAWSTQQVVAHAARVHEIMREVMREGEHYGVIPGTQKPTLLKPGAEKIGLTFRLYPEYDVDEKQLPGGHREYRILCRLRTIDSGNLVGVGVGVCSTMESKYRYRSTERLCPECGKPTIRKGKEDKPSWYCWKKIGGCGVNFRPDDQRITAQTPGKAENPDIADTYNTVLKMAKKRAHVDAVITATAASDIFTQDVEETLPPESGGGPPQPLEGERATPQEHRGTEEQPPPDAPHVDVVQEWVDAFDACTDIAKCQALWKSVQKALETFTGQDQVRMTMAKDRAKVRLQQKEEQGTLV